MLLPSAALAAGSPPQTIITGTVTHLGTAVSGATVTVVCNGVSQTDATDSQGGYYVVDTSANWPDGASVTATATKGSLSGSNTGTVNALSSKINQSVYRPCLSSAPLPQRPRLFSARRPSSSSGVADLALPTEGPPPRISTVCRKGCRSSAQGVGSLFRISTCNFLVSSSEHRGHFRRRRAMRNMEPHVSVRASAVLAASGGCGAHLPRSCRVVKRVATKRSTAIEDNP